MKSITFIIITNNNGNSVTGAVAYVMFKKWIQIGSDVAYKDHVAFGCIGRFNCVL